MAKRKQASPYKKERDRLEVQRLKGLPEAPPWKEDKPIEMQDTESVKKRLANFLSPNRNTDEYSDELPYVASPFQSVHMDMPDPAVFEAFERLKRVEPNLPDVKKISTIPKPEHFTDSRMSGTTVLPPAFGSATEGEFYNDWKTGGKGAEIYIKPTIAGNVNYPEDKYDLRHDKNRLAGLLGHELTHGSDNIFAGEENPSEVNDLIDELSTRNKLPWVNKPKPIPKKPTKFNKQVARPTKEEPKEYEWDKDYDSNIKELKGLIEPTPKMMKFNEGTEYESEVPLPHHPYPFKNPITMSKDIDDSVKGLRTKYAPGAGTANTSVVSKVGPIADIADMIRSGGDDPKYKALANEVMKGNFDIKGLNLLGLASPIPDEKRVYINPRLEGSDLDSTVAHELSHRNNPPTSDAPHSSYRVSDLMRKLSGYDEAERLVKKYKLRR